MTKHIIPYTEEYKHKCFQAWFAAGRPSRPISILKVIPEDETGRKPNKSILSGWRRDMQWDMKGEDLFSKAIEIANTGLIAKKAEMLERQAQTGFDLQNEGLKYLKEEGFDSASSAVSAVFKGAVMERESRGLSEALLKIAKMTDEEIKKEIAGLIQKGGGDGTVIDVDAVDIDEEEEIEDDTVSSDPEYDLPEN